ncbi:histidine kinase [Geobacter pelophilus]|uniref:histidine kinase n=1 Tax=Geoanaerobacter pelophilus TaxID=60036 RepID=A0AAW4L0G5_9BACT|nr:histidine kinase [Geoanaerobacter pelophilus]
MGLFFDLFERLGIFAILFIFLLRFKAFKRLLTGDADRYDKMFMALAFGMAGVVATYGGFPVQGAIANLRGVPVALAGVLGGPLVGLTSGLVAGSHRFLMDPYGMTSLPCGIATMVQGVTAAMLYHRLRRKQYDSIAAFMVGAVNEGLKMLLILLMQPYESAISLVSLLAIPSMLVNGLGIAVFVQLISTVYKEQQLAKAEQAQTTLGIAFRTLPFLRNGLTKESARETAAIIREMTGIDAVLIADKEQILASEGWDSDRSHVSPAAVDVVQSALVTGQISLAMTAAGAGINPEASGLRSAVAVPLKKQGQTIGVLALFRGVEQGITPLDQELASGLSLLFANQMELADLENHRNLAAAAEIKAMQAQINPHFLFNAISTIISYIRTDPKTASTLLVNLAELFRKSTATTDREVPLSVELEHCDAYLTIEKARFEERIDVRYEIDDSALPCPVPPLILQPLVENGIRHGLLSRDGGGRISICAHKDEHELLIRIEDNGIGISREQLATLFTDHSGGPAGEGLGIALKNVNGRLVALYGKDRGLKIESEPGVGTAISFSVPVPA